MSSFLYRKVGSMQYFWSKFLVGFLIVEVVVFAAFYYFGPDGITRLYALKQQRVQLACELQQVEKEIEFMEKELVAWQEELFLKEKFAREKLCMQKDNETVYLR